MYYFEFLSSPAIQITIAAIDGNIKIAIRNAIERRDETTKIGLVTGPETEIAMVIEIAIATTIVATITLEGIRDTAEVADRETTGITREIGNILN